MYALVLHGGAGAIQKNKMSADEQETHLQALRECLQKGATVLQEGGSSVDAVVASVMALEDCPLYNAGKGAVLNRQKQVELDASIMCGQTLQAGGASLLRRVKNPILAAQAIMQKTSHSLLAGEGAEEIARNEGLEMVEPSYFVTAKRLEQLEQALSQPDVHLFLDHDDHTKPGCTVGAVALDQRGNLAAATSTGGLTMKMPGRVSDSSIIGAGTYANNESCAVSTTGTGDIFILHSTAAMIHSLMRHSQKNLKEACDLALATVEKSNGTGGLIALNAKGEIYTPFISGGMFRAWIDTSGQTQAAIF
jgi:L-asparaginase / beta-aspartyl-peptidase